MALFRRAYGHGPLHLLAMLIALAFAGYAIASIFQNPQPWKVLLWLFGVIIVHDFVLLPLYTALYRVAWKAGRASHDERRRVAKLHHIVAPAVISGVLLLISLPLVFRLSERNYVPTTGMTPDPYVWRWLALTGGLFLASGLLYLVRRRHLGRSTTTPGTQRAAAEPGQGLDVP